MSPCQSFALCSSRMYRERAWLLGRIQPVGTPMVLVLMCSTPHKCQGSKKLFVGPTWGDLVQGSGSSFADNRVCKVHSKNIFPKQSLYLQQTLPGKGGNQPGYPDLFKRPAPAILDCPTALVLVMPILKETVTILGNR